MEHVALPKGNLPNHFEDQESEQLPVSFIARMCISWFKRWELTCNGTRRMVLSPSSTANLAGLFCLCFMWNIKERPSLSEASIVKCLCPRGPFARNVRRLRMRAPLFQVWFVNRWRELQCWKCHCWTWVQIFSTVSIRSTKHPLKNKKTHELFY